MMLDRNGELNEGNLHLLRQMERYAARVGCRHQHLSEYFGDRYSVTGCGACDFCLGELETAEEPTVVARKILSCVVRVGQRFGIAHVTSVLRGQASEQVLARGHDRLSTFGLLAEAPVTEIRGYVEQLIGLGLLQQSEDVYPVLTLTTRGVALLKDAAAVPDLTLARQRRPRRDAVRPTSRVEAESWQGVDRELFERLRATRLEVARARGVPPYVIFHDATLREMARLRPTTRDDLRLVRGVGARKVEDLGDIFLTAIRGAQSGARPQSADPA
jgi:ATP-dependent DNA helicase RecQ